MPRTMNGRVSVAAAPQQRSCGQDKLVGRSRMDLGGLLQLPPPFCDPFREMVVHPGVVSRLLWLEGAGFKANTGMCICSENGCAGQTLHGNPFVAPGRNCARSHEQLSVGSSAERGVRCAQMRSTRSKTGGYGRAL